MKTCRRCGTDKPMLEFYAHRSTRDGRANYCMECQKATSADWRARNPDVVKAQNRRYDRTKKGALHRRFWLKLYGLTVEQYEVMAAAQGGACAICHKPETALDARTKQPRRLAVDHCHSTGQVRGLLCMTCNRMLGAAKDNPTVLQSAIDYLSAVTPMT